MEYFSNRLKVARTQFDQFIDLTFYFSELDIEYGKYWPDIITTHL